MFVKRYQAKNYATYSSVQIVANFFLFFISRSKLNCRDNQLISKLFDPPAGHRGTSRDVEGHRGTSRDIEEHRGTSWDAYVLDLSCVRLVLVNYKIINICKLTVCTFCTKTHLSNLKRNKESLHSSLPSLRSLLLLLLLLH